MKYRIESATKTERFITISKYPAIVHIYRYDNHELLLVATVFPTNAGFNPIQFHDEKAFKNVKNIKEAKDILKTHNEGEVKSISNNDAYELLCP